MQYIFFLFPFYLSIPIYLSKIRCNWPLSLILTIYSLFSFLWSTCNFTFSSSAIIELCMNILHYYYYSIILVVILWSPDNSSYSEVNFSAQPPSLSNLHCVSLSAPPPAYSQKLQRIVMCSVLQKKGEMENQSERRAKSGFIIIIILDISQLSVFEFQCECVTGWAIMYNWSITVDTQGEIGML